MSERARRRGFTLVEVLVALVLLALVLAAGSTAVRSGARGALELETRLFAHWAGANALAEAMLAPHLLEPADDAVRHDTTIMGRKFEVLVATRERRPGGLLETRVDVRAADSNGALIESFSQVHASQ